MQEFDYGLMVSTPISMASAYNLAVPAIHPPMTPDPSPVDHVQIEFTDLAAPYPEDRNYKPRKQDGKAQPSTSMHMRRRAQNRASQRAFRERKEKHTQDLQRRLSEVEHQYDSLKQQYERCQQERDQLELQARRCSCGGHEVLTSASEAGSPATVTSLSGSLSGSLNGSNGEGGECRGSATGSVSAADPAMASFVTARAGAVRLGGGSSTIRGGGGGTGPAVADGLQDLDGAYWGAEHHRESQHC